MKPNCNLSLAVGCLIFAGILPVLAQNYTAVHWINDAGQNGATVLNTNGIFLTDFKGSNDFKVTPIDPNNVILYTDVFNGSFPGDNPWYITNFLGVSTNGTGDGTRGDIENLEMTYSATGTLQFDFAIPLSPNDRVLLIDVDGPEQYLVEAFAFDGSNYNQVSMAGWIAEDFTGTAGELPNSSWPIWNGATGSLGSGTSGNLDEELFVLTPDRLINRMTIIKQNGSSWSTDITFLSVTSPLSIQRAGGNVVLGWTNSGVNLQTAFSVTGPWTNIIGAINPYTNAITASQQYFRLYPK